MTTKFDMKVTSIDNRDSNTTHLHLPNNTILEVTRSDLQMLIDNMDENNPPKKTYQIHVLLIEQDGVECDFLEEEEVIGCKDEYDNLNDALLDYNKVRKVDATRIPLQQLIKQMDDQNDSYEDIYSVLLHHLNEEDADMTVREMLTRAVEA